MVRKMLPTVLSKGHTGPRCLSGEGLPLQDLWFPRKAPWQPPGRQHSQACGISKWAGPHVFRIILQTHKGPTFLLCGSCNTLKLLSGRQVSPHPLTGRATRLSRAFLRRSPTLSRQWAEPFSLIPSVQSQQTAEQEN